MKSTEDNVENRIDTKSLDRELEKIPKDLDHEKVVREVNPLLLMLSETDGRLDQIYLDKLKRKFGLHKDTILSLKKIVKDNRKSKAKEFLSSETEIQNQQYIINNSEICRVRYTENGPVNIPLCNFSATIAEEEIRDDGAEKKVYLAISGRLSTGDEFPLIRVKGQQFSSMSWITEAWGASAIVYAGYSNRDHLRAAIQLLSAKQEINKKNTYLFTGWQLIDKELHFLSANGAIGAKGTNEKVSVDLGNSRQSYYELPGPVSGEPLEEAVLKSLSILDLGPEEVTIPLLAAIYRAPLAEFLPITFTLAFIGGTGCQKTELTALAQAHFGRNFSGKNLPANWNSTANSLERAAFAAKDVIFVIDDFAPGGSSTDREKLYKKADNVIRGAGNRSGRGRMRPDGSLRPEYYPRGLIITSGEDVPIGHSLLARMIIIEMAKGDVDLKQLTKLQKVAEDGVFATSMSCYVEWLANRTTDLPDVVTARLTEYRNKAKNHNSTHDRTPDNIASLFLGLDLFLEFAVDVAEITIAKAKEIREAGWQRLLKIAANQTRHQLTEEPSRLFIELLSSAFLSGRAHLKCADTGTGPENSSYWGWKQCTNSLDYLPGGDHIGWLKGDLVLLNRKAAFAAMQKFARERGVSLSIREDTLWKRLSEHNIMVEKEENRHSSRHTIVGKRTRVVAIHKDSFIDENMSQMDQSNHYNSSVSQLAQLAHPVNNKREKYGQEKNCAWEERAAILEYDAKFSRDEAEALASQQLSEE